jgi:hypothetical protein
MANFGAAPTFCPANTWTVLPVTANYFPIRTLSVTPVLLPSFVLRWRAYMSNPPHFQEGAYPITSGSTGLAVVGPLVIGAILFLTINPGISCSCAYNL